MLIKETEQVKNSILVSWDSSVPIIIRFGVFIVFPGKEKNRTDFLGELKGR